MNDLITIDIDTLLKEEESIIKQTGVQGAWIIGEQLSIAKQKIIEATGDGRAPGFVEWVQRKFGWIQSTAWRLMDAYHNHEEDIKKIWGNVKKHALTHATPSLPAEKYHVIYADPPWKYTEDGLTGVSNKDTYGNVDKFYPQLTIQELCELPIKEMVDENAVLFLWVTSPFLEKCLAVIEAWGFEYKSSFVWDKVKHNFGYYNSVRHEFLLICTKGSCRPDNPKLYDSVQTIERTGHSVKPEEFRAIIDDLYDGKKIELFARRKVSGWDVWGNEV